MSVLSLPPHLPEPFPDTEAYARSYEFIRLVDDVYHGDPDDWREARIPPGQPAEAVYRRLATAPDFEYAGYLTRTRVRYAPGWDAGAHCHRQQALLLPQPPDRAPARRPALRQGQPIQLPEVQPAAARRRWSLDHLGV